MKQGRIENSGLAESIRVAEKKNAINEIPKKVIIKNQCFSKEKIINPSI